MKVMCLHMHLVHCTCHGCIFKSKTYFDHNVIFFYFHDSLICEYWDTGIKNEEYVSDVRGERSIIYVDIQNDIRLIPCGGESFPFVPEGMSMHGGGVDKIHRRM